MLDFHCHILPAVDDGSRSLEESVEMLKAAKSVGIDRMICTSHIKKRGMTMDHLKKAFELLRPHAEEMGIKLTLGAECNLSAIDPMSVSDAERFCIEGTKKLLLEMPYDYWPPRWKEIIYKLNEKDIEITMAHPERYSPIKNDIKKMIELLDEMYCDFQVTAGSIRKGLLGITDPTIKFLIKNGYVKYIATDAHSVSDYACLPQALEIAAKYGFSDRKMR